MMVLNVSNAARRALFAGCLVMMGTQVAFAQRDLKTIPPPDPELERKTFELPEGFEVNLFAADPALAKPIQMNFDPQGRLWVATSHVYPHIEPGQKSDDRVLILEDVDNDGVSDRTTVFADGLLIPTGVAPGDGGAYVANSTELLHLEDTDGDGRADRRRIVLSGFGTEDTHHILHTFRWGPDGALYFNQSIYIHSHIETPYGVERLNGGGIWRFQPESMQLDVFARGWVNAWGHQFDDFGNSFVTDGAGGQGINYALPGGAYTTAVGVERILPGLNPGSPKYCGLEIVGGSKLPDDWQGDLITHDFRGHRVCRFKVSTDGAGFTSRQMPDLIRSTHVAFRPVDVAMGPDGAIYIADWYNPIIQHGEVDFRDERRDQTHGRIWRVTYKGREPLPRRNMTEQPTPALLAELASVEPWRRQAAKQVLRERDAQEVSAAVARWVETLDPNDAQAERLRLEAAWVWQSVRSPQPKFLVELAKASNPQVRAATARIAGDWLKGAVAPLMPLLGRLARDPDPHVRLEAVRALAKNDGDPQSVRLALAALEQPTDQWLDYALWLTCRETSAAWLPLLERGEFRFDGSPEALAFALRAVGSPRTVSTLTQLVRDGRLTGPQADEALKVVAELGQTADLRFVFDTIFQTSERPGTQAALLGRLVESARRRKAKPSGELLRLTELFAAETPSVRSRAMQLAGVWKLESARNALASLATSQDSSAEDRQAAFAALELLGGPESQKLFVDVATSERSWSTRRLAVTALVTLDPQAAAPRAVSLLSNAPEDAVIDPVFQAFLARKTGPAALVAALQDSRLPADVARVGLRTIDASGQTLPALSAALTKAGGITSGPRQLSLEEMQRMVAAVQASGDVHRGEAVYRRADLACLTCHAIAGAGGQVGPDLVSLGGSAQVDYVIDSLLQPNKAIKENYHSLVVATDEGKVLTGVKVRQTGEELVLRDAEDRLVTVPLASIVDQKPGQSLMPAGLVEKLTRQELMDLVRFLSELGKVGGVTVGPEEVARRWRVLLPTEAAKHRLRRTGYEVAATDDPAFTWQPAYSTVAGDLPQEAVPVLSGLPGPRAGEPEVGFVRTELELSQPGRVRLGFDSPTGLQLWVGPVPTPAADEVELNLPAGRHRLTLAVQSDRPAKTLRLEVLSEDPPARFVTGK